MKRKLSLTEEEIAPQEVELNIPDDWDLILHSLQEESDIPSDILEIIFLNLKSPVDRKNFLLLNKRSNQLRYRTTAVVKTFHSFLFSVIDAIPLFESHCHESVFAGLLKTSLTPIYISCPSLPTFCFGSPWFAPNSSCPLPRSGWLLRNYPQYIHQFKAIKFSEDDSDDFDLPDVSEFSTFNFQEPSDDLQRLLEECSLYTSSVNAIYSEECFSLAALHSSTPHFQAYSR